MYNHPAQTGVAGSRLGQVVPPAPPPDAPVRGQLEHVETVLCRVSINLSEIERKIAGVQQGAPRDVVDTVAVEQSVAMILHCLSQLVATLETATDRINSSL